MVGYVAELNFRCLNNSQYPLRNYWIDNLPFDKGNENSISVWQQALVGKISLSLIVFTVLFVIAEFYRGSSVFMLQTPWGNPWWWAPGMPGWWSLEMPRWWSLEMPRWWSLGMSRC